MKKLVYLACPFRHPDPEMRKKRCAVAHTMAAQLSAEYYVFSPLTHNEILVSLAPELPREHWIEFDLRILKTCDKLLILTLDGWETSWGVQKEIAFAKENNIPIEEIEVSISV